MMTTITEATPDELGERAAELSAWCDLDPPTTRDLEASLRRDTDQVCFVGPGGQGALIVVPRIGSATVKYLAVPPASRRQGIGAALLQAAEGWAAANGYGNVLFGLAAPGYLWPGVEMGLTTLETFLDGRGYHVAMWAVNQLVELPADIPAGQARRARPDEEELVAAFCRKHYANWETEVRWSFDEAEPKCAVWIDHDNIDHDNIDHDNEDGLQLLGFACWSVTREGWFGPMATRPDLRQKNGIGTGTLSVALAGLADDGYRAVEISWVGPERFYAKVAGARTHRAFRVYQRTVSG